MEIFAWPAVALLLGIIAIFAFRQPFSRFLDRADRIGRDGIQATGGSQVGTAGVKATPADELLKEFDNALLLERETIIRTELDKRSISVPADRERVLIRYLAALVQVQIFERTYNLIFGSQIATLQALNSSGQIEISAIRPFYEQAAKNEPQFYQGYSFEQWLNFLTEGPLIKKTGDTIAITVGGREFLKYLVGQGFPLNRRG